MKLGKIVIRWINDPKLLFGLRLLVGCLFFYAGFSKLIQPIESFEIVVRWYNIIPDMMMPLVTFLVPWTELIFGTYILLGFSLKKSCGVLIVLNIMFQLIVGQALIRKLPIDECGCFGGGFIHLSLYQSFTLNTILVLILILIIQSGKNILCLDTLTKKIS